MTKSGRQRGAPRRFLGFGEVSEEDIVSTADEIRRGDFVFFERLAPHEVVMRIVPRGALLRARRDGPRTMAVLSNPAAARDVPEAPLYEVDLSQAPSENDDGTISFGLFYRQVQLVDDPMALAVAQLRSLLPKLPRARTNRIPGVEDGPLSDFFFYYRDSPDFGPVAGIYEPGRVLLERGFIDATTLRGGPAGSVRFLIASREGADMEALEPDGWGMVTLPCESHLLVVDHFAPSATRRQITLLHVPTGALLKPFLASLDDETLAALCQSARADFDALQHVPPANASMSMDWRRRVAEPLGVDGEGRPVEGEL